MYCNESGSYITRNDFNKIQKLEQSLQPHTNCYHQCYEPTVGSNPSDLGTVAPLFSIGQDRVSFEQFRLWLTINKHGTGLSRWLLIEPCVSLSSDLEMPTFYQTLAGVTHLEEHVSLSEKFKLD